MPAEKNSNSIKLNKIFRNGTELKGLPDSKPFALLSREGSILFSNMKFNNMFDVTVGDDLTKVWTEPKFPTILENFSKSKYLDFHSDILVKNNQENLLFKTNVDIIKLVIKRKTYFLLSLNTLDKSNKVEERIFNLSRAIDYSGIAVLVTDSHGYVNYVSPSFEKVFHKRIDQIFNNYLPYVLVEFLNKGEVEELKYALKNGKEWIKIITDLNRKNELWFKEIKLNPVLQMDGLPNSYIVVASDITNYVLRNRYIKHSEEKQKSIINNISDPLLIARRTDGQLFFENVNEIFQSAFNVQKEEISDQKLKPFLPQSLYDLLIKLITKIEGSGKSSGQIKYYHRELNKNYIVKLTYIDDQHSKERIFIAVLNDITDHLLVQDKLREAYVKENQLNKLKSIFLANMSHEIRTPLNAIVGYSELLEDDLVNKNYSSSIEMVKSLKEGVSRLLSLVDNIVEVSLLESGSEKLDLARSNLNNLIAEIYNEYKSKRKNLFVKTLLLLSSEKLIVRTDEEKFRKIIDALFENAIKYNEYNGNVIIKSRSKNNRAIIQIIDDGIGIAEKDLKKIMDPFAQSEEESYKRKYEGAGLGLTIAYRLTTLLGGSFNITSEPEKGTTITLTFPLD